MTKTLQQHFERFDYVNPEIRKGIFIFTEASKDIQYRVFNFEYITSENAVKEIKDAGYEPATFSELLAWPDWNEKDWVVALGSVGRVFGSRRVPCLVRSGSERGLGLGWWVGCWGSYYRFLGTKLSSDSRISETPALIPLDTLILGRIENKLDALLNHLGIKL